MQEPRPTENSIRRTPASMQAEIDRRMSTPSRGAAPVQVAKPVKQSFFARLFGRGEKAPAPSSRKPCVVVGVLMILDRNLALDGMVLGINEKTLLFRQASTFVFDRTGAEISIRFADLDRRGRIIETTAKGYVIQFAEPMPLREIAVLLSTYGGHAGQ